MLTQLVQKAQASHATLSARVKELQDKELAARKDKQDTEARMAQERQAAVDAEAIKRKAAEAKNAALTQRVEELTTQLTQLVVFRFMPGAHARGSRRVRSSQSPRRSSHTRLHTTHPLIDVSAPRSHVS